jgi:hypothetical protein
MWVHQCMFLYICTVNNEVRGIHAVYSIVSEKEDVQSEREQLFDLVKDGDPRQAPLKRIGYTYLLQPVGPTVDFVVGSSISSLCPFSYVEMATTKHAAH